MTRPTLFFLPPVLAVALCLTGCQTDDASTRLYRYPEPGQAGDPERARVLNREGIAAYRAGDLVLAEERFNAALRAGVTFGPAHNSLGRLHYDCGDYYRAAVAFENAARLLPHAAEPRNNLGLVYEAVGRLRDASDQYDRALAIEPDRVELLANRLRADLRAGDDAETHRAELEDLVLRAPNPRWRTWAQEQLLHARPAPRGASVPVEVAPE